MAFNSGDRVRFVNNCRNYTIGSSNPLVGTPYECEGTIEQAGLIGVSVKWDNGTKNTYDVKTLALSEGHRVISIW